MKVNYIDCCDCLSAGGGISSLPAGSIDMILCDLPYGTTRNKWDSVIPMDALWAEYERVIKENGAIVLFSQMPFTAVLAQSNSKLFRYEWIWVKDNATGFLNANKMPLKLHENILVFYKKPPVYNPQFGDGKPYAATHSINSSNYGKHNAVTTKSDGKRFPVDVVKFQRDSSRVHPTQKPVSLCEYLIKTYTNPGDVVLDNCIGSGTTAVACIRTGRNFIGFESNKDYYDIAVERVKETKLS